MTDILVDRLWARCWYLISHDDSFSIEWTWLLNQFLSSFPLSPSMIGIVQEKGNYPMTWLKILFRFLVHQSDAGLGKISDLFPIFQSDECIFYRQFRPENNSDKTPLSVSSLEVGLGWVGGDRGSPILSLAPNHPLYLLRLHIRTSDSRESN